jgi:hypothetical protein
LYEYLDGSKLALYQTAALKKPKRFSVIRSQRTHIPPKANGDLFEDDIEVLCVNCMKMIKTSCAAEHSLKCSQVKNEVKLIDQCSLVQQADYKLRKLKESLQQVNNAKQETQILLKHCNDALNISGFTKIDILKCRELIYNLHTLAKTLKTSIYVERLIIIVKEKYSQLLNYYKDTADTQRLTEEVKIELIKDLNEALNVDSREVLTYNPVQVKDTNTKGNEVVSDAEVTE